MPTLKIFDEQIARKPDLYPWTQDFIKSMWQGHWTPDEFTFASDVQDFKTKLTEQEQIILTRGLSAIGQVEIAVKLFWSKLGINLPHPSLSDLGLVMASIEVIHNNAYEKLLDVLGLNAMFEENLKLDIIKNRVNYLRKYTHRYYTDSKKQYVYAITLFTLFVENVSLFSQFYTTLWIMRKNSVCKDTVNMIDYTVLEEHIHAMVGMKIINTIREEYPELFDEELEQRIASEAMVAFEAESKIIDWMLMDSSYDETLNPAVVKEYVKNRINKSFKEIKFAPVFEINQDLIAKTVWMDEQELADNMTDFFYKKSTAYAKSHAAFNAESLF